MKRTLALGLLLLIVFISGSKMIFAQEVETTVKSTLTNLLEFSKSKSYEKASALIAYDGDDKTRIQKDAFNSANNNELSQVKRVCKKIAALLDLSSKHVFGKFETKKDGINEIYSIEVNFISGDQKLVTAFSFIKTDKGYLLSNVN